MTKWLVGFLMLFLFLTAISGVVENTYLGGAETSRLDQLMKPTMPSYSNPIGGIIAVFDATWDYLSNLWGIFWFDYAMFTGQWVFIQYLFMSVSIGIIASSILAIATR